jgi:hypothetical protein
VVEQPPTIRRASRLTAELVVIVVGVLIALAVDAGWESRQDRSRLAAYLSQIRSDLVATEAALQEAIATDSLARFGAGQLELGLNAHPTAPPDSLDVWLVMTTQASLFHPRSGTVQALVRSADIRLVSDPELHQSLVEYLDAVEAFYRLDSDLYAIAIQAFGRLGHEVNLRTQVNLSRGAEPPDWTALAADPGVTSEIRQIRISANVRMSLLWRLRDSHGALLAALASQQ